MPKHHFCGPKCKLRFHRGQRSAVPDGDGVTFEPVHQPGAGVVSESIQQTEVIEALPPERKNQDALGRYIGEHDPSEMCKKHGVMFMSCKCE